MVLERWFTPEFRAARPETVESAGNMLRGTPVEGYAGCCEALRDADVRAGLGRSGLPLVIAGAEDPAATVDQAKEIRDSIPQARLVVVEAAHLANIEQPEAVCVRSWNIWSRPWGTEDDLGRLYLRSRYESPSRGRRRARGPDHRGTTEFTADFQDFITRYAWGEIWSRPAWTAKREAASPSPLVALGRLDELELHVRAAVRNGLTEQEIGEVFLQSAVYCGAPAANSAFAVAQRSSPKQGRR